MDPTQLPSLADLTGAYGAWNPQAYMQAQDNLGLNQQFLQQGLQQQQNKTQEGTLKNLFTIQDDPNRIQERLLTNQGKQYTNETTGLGLERAKANQQNILNEDQRKAALSATDDDMKAWDQHVYQLMRSNDPRQRQEAEQMQKLMPAFQEARRKHADDLEKINIQRASAERIAGGNNATTLAAARMSQEGQDRRAALKQQKMGAAKDIMAGVQSGKIGFEKAATYFTFAAMNEEDPELRAKFEQQAQQFEQANLNQRNATASGKADVGALAGVPTQKVVPALGATKQAPALPPGWVMK